MIDSSPFLWSCILSMSAAHLYQDQETRNNAALQFQTEAISLLSDRLSDLAPDMPSIPGLVVHETGPLCVQKSHGVGDDVLLGAILLGMTLISYQFILEFISSVDLGTDRLFSRPGMTLPPLVYLTFTGLVSYSRRG